jgi:predicted dinucleotide-binding enzyme
MTYAIVGFGKIGQALAYAFARKNINVTVASRRPPEALAPPARAIGPTVVAKSLQDALEAETIILAVRSGNTRGCEGHAELERQDGHRRDERVWSSP